VTGGVGADLFVFNTKAAGFATIVDFSSGVDQLQFKATAFGGVSGSTAVSNTNFITATNAPNISTGYGHVGFTENTTNGNLYYQSSATGPAIQVAIIGDGSHHLLTAGDIHFI